MEKADAYKRLTEHGIRPSLQRLAILDYLIKHTNHPNVDQDDGIQHPSYVCRQSRGSDDNHR